MRTLLAALLILAVTPAAARECPLARATLVPVDDPSGFAFQVRRDGHSYRFDLVEQKSKAITRFIGSFQNGTGFLYIDEEPEERKDERGAAKDSESDAKGSGISSRGVFFSRKLKSVDPWDKRPLVAYAFFDQLMIGLRDKGRTAGRDDAPTPPDGLWRVGACRKKD